MVRKQKICIITPVHNGAEHILDAAQSVVNQTLPDWRWIIVNDGSTDGTETILSKLSDPRIVVLSQLKAGVSAARNAGLEAATGEFVTFLDSDDVLPPDALLCRVEYFKAHDNVDIVSGRIAVTEDGARVRTYRASSEIGPFFPRISRLDEAVFFGPFYMVRRERIGRHRFPVGISHCEDLIFFLELAHDEDLVYGAVDAEVYEYRRRPDSAMSDLAGIEAGYLALLEQAARLGRMTPAGLRYLKWRIARIMVKSWLRRGDLSRAARAAVRVAGISA